MKIVPRYIEYAGVLEPRTPEEMEIEIYGLKNAICQAEELISRHEQAIALARLTIRQKQEIAHAVETGSEGAGEESDLPAPEEAEG